MGRRHRGAKHLDLDDAAMWRELERVGEEVVQDLSHAVWIARYGQGTVRTLQLDIDTLGTRGALVLGDDSTRELPKVDLAKMNRHAAVLGSGDVEKIVDDTM